MAAAAFVRAAIRARPAPFSRFVAQKPASSSSSFIRVPAASFTSTRTRAAHDPHGEETFEEFTDR